MFRQTILYPVLEWVLIFLLLLNSLFSYFIAKFADYFGLKHPCLWCSRIDHVLDRGENVKSIKADFMCNRHALEISGLGYCHRHQKLAKSQEMCENCSLTSVAEEETVSRCSCCNGRLEGKVFPSCLLLKPSWCSIEGTGREIESIGAKKCDSPSGTEDRTDEGVADVDDEHQIISDLDSFSIREITSEEECSKSLSNFRWHEKDATGDGKDAFCGIEAMRESCDSNNMTRISLVEDSWIEVIDLQFIMRYDGPCDSSDRLHLIDLIDSSIIGNVKLPNLREEGQHSGMLQVDTAAELDQNNADSETKREPDELSPANDAEETANDKETGDFEPSGVIATGEKGIDDPEHELDQSQLQGDLPSANGDGSKDTDAEILGTEEILGEKDTDQTHNLEAEEEKFPDTPTSLESLQNWQKKLLLLEKRESSIEESLDGSVLSEIMDGGDGLMTIERLKSALTAERKALKALYAELEEERSASAIAANQTMAMITRLQEEKATMQMEALQYQRMMEEQSEYDQEALQMLNELMVKREKEKQELEGELEIYKAKVSEYEAKERLRGESPIKDCDDDELSIDLNREMGDQSENEEANTPNDEAIDLEELAIDCVKNMSELDNSLAEFEEERLSILDQLKSLEEKLLTMSNDGEAIQLRDMETKEDSLSYLESGTMRKMAKRLLPLLDAADDEAEEEVGIRPQNAELLDTQMPELEEGEREAKRIDIVEEVDRVYERLQALEEDREFLKHCMSTVKKGDEGMDLLQEILQHLRDLKSVELRVKDIGDE
ncbi:myosin-binding protein 3-like isoform X2 [Punica granatum]|uniref:Myosin-binding protein 3-like isoform X2 n=1 Tax=Punica granatum TaxID=22663 RepID=A0A6P8DHA7_PUNGR|nr:myosin-binding protein 3-like isoform X2 [Punica granatum]